MSEPVDYGCYYYCIRVIPQICEKGEVYAMADVVEVSDGGDLLLSGNNRLTLAFAAGQWLAVYGASVIDGAPVSVEHWDEEF